MKNVFINSRQYRLLKEHVEAMNKADAIRMDLVGDIDKNQTPISFDEPYVKKALTKLLVSSFIDSTKDFNDDITKHDEREISNKLNKLVLQCQHKEANVREQLEKLCADTVMSCFDTDGVILECNLAEKMLTLHSEPTADDEHEYTNLSEIEQENSDVERRKIFNTLIFGAAMSLTEKTMTKILNEIFNLDEELPHLYSKIFKINRYLSYVSTKDVSDEDSMTGGYEEVRFKEDGSVKITSSAMIFPFLLFESFRGLFEYLVSKDEEEERNAIIIRSSDNIKFEPWYLRIGQKLWNNLTDGSSFGEKSYQKVFDKLLSIDNRDFIGIVKEVIAGTRDGKDFASALSKTVKRESDYQDFERSLKQKQSETGLIEDEYLKNFDF